MKKFKSMLSLLLVCALLFCAVPAVSAAKSFSDLPASHWASSYVAKLVSDGTINGFTDGTFRPTATVSRAEFVKMLGKSSVAYQTDFTDVPKSHWAYDYIKYADMDVSGDEFRPADAITRNDVLKLLFRRAGSPNGAVAPGCVTSQSDSSDAAAWAYVYGIMNGSDGVDLKLSDSLTRAEAAALICRARELNSSSKKYSLTEIVNDDVLAKVYSSFDFFGDTYSPERTLTNGELAYAFAVLTCEQVHLTYSALVSGYSVDRPYSYPFYTYCYYIAGTDNMTEEFYDKAATNEDAVAALTFAARRKTDKVFPTAQKGVCYADVTSSDENKANLLSVAYADGLRLDNDNNIKPKESLTVRNFALLILQLDYEAGFNSSVEIQTYGAFKKDTSLRTDIYTYPAKASAYKFILKDVSNDIYNKDYVDENGKLATGLPKDFFQMARDYYSPFATCLNAVKYSAKDCGADVLLTYYPSMVCESEKGYVMRIKINVESVDGVKTFNEVFPSNIKSDFKLEPGMEIYADLATGAKLSGLQLPADNVVFTQIVSK